MMYTDEQDEMLETLDEIKFYFGAVENDSTVCIGGKYVANSQVALLIAKKALRVSEILRELELQEEQEGWTWHILIYLRHYSG